MVVLCNRTIQRLNFILQIFGLVPSIVEYYQEKGKVNFFKSAVEVNEMLSVQIRLSRTGSMNHGACNDPIVTGSSSQKINSLQIARTSIQPAVVEKTDTSNVVENLYNDVYTDYSMKVGAPVYAESPLTFSEKTSPNNNINSTQYSTNLSGSQKIGLIYPLIGPGLHDSQITPAYKKLSIITHNTSISGSRALGAGLVTLAPISNDSKTISANKNVSDLTGATNDSVLDTTYGSKIIQGVNSGSKTRRMKRRSERRTLE